MTDAEYIRWLQNGARQGVILAELAYGYDIGGAPQTGTLYLSDAPYATGSAETPASVAYVDAIAAAPGFARELDRNTLGGRARFSVGTLELDNTDGGLDHLLARIVDGYEASFFLGASSWARADFREVFTATMSSIRADETRLTIELRDNAALLDKRIVGAVIGGSSANAGSRRQLIFGQPIRVEAVMSDTTALRYFVGSDLAGAFIHVYENGIFLGRSEGLNQTPSIQIVSGAINADTDTITYAGHGFIEEDVVYLTSVGFAFPPTSNPQINFGDYFWIRNRTADTFQISTTRTGSVVDFVNTGTFVGTLVFRYCGFYPYTSGEYNGAIELAHPTDNSAVVAASYDVPPFAGFPAGSDRYRFETIIEHIVTVEAEFSAFAGAHESAVLVGDGNPTLDLVISEPTNVMDVLDDLVLCINGFWSITRDGQFQYGRVLPDGSTAFATATYTLTDDDVEARSVTLDRLAPTYSRFSVGYNRNWTPQPTGLVEGLSPADTLYASQEYATAVSSEETGTSYATAPSLYHKTLTESPETLTLLHSSAAATYWLTKARARWAPYVEIITLRTHLGFYLLELGDVVDLNLGVLGLDNVSAQVIGIDVSLSDARITLTLVRRRAPVHPDFSVDVSWVELEVPT